MGYIPPIRREQSQLYAERLRLKKTKVKKAPDRVSGVQKSRRVHRDAYRPRKKS